MNLRKITDRAVTLAAAAAAPVITLLVDTGTLAPQTGVDVAAVVAALVAGWHGHAQLASPGRHRRILPEAE